MRGSELDPLLAAFGDALREVRMDQGISQADLAARAGLQRTYVTDVEGGRRNLSLLNIGRLCDALGIPLDVLMARTERRLCRR